MHILDPPPPSTSAVEAGNGVGVAVGGSVVSWGPWWGWDGSVRGDFTQNQATSSLECGVCLMPVWPCWASQEAVQSDAPQSPAQPLSCDLLPLVSYAARVSGQSTPSSRGTLSSGIMDTQMHLLSPREQCRLQGAPEGWGRDTGGEASR